jgi:mitochondrial protein MBA1
MTLPTTLFTSLYRLASSKGGIPDHHGPLNPYTFKIFSASSTKPTSWLTPLRKTALDRYKTLNSALASNDTTSLRQISVDPLQAEYRNRLKNRATNVGGLRYVWKFHSEASPTRCVSIRANEGYVSSVPPKTGNTLFVHAVMRFDTMQVSFKNVFMTV